MDSATPPDFGAAIVEIRNRMGAIAGPVLERAVRSLSPGERGRERDRWIRAAAALLPSGTTHARAVAIRARLLSLAKAPPAFVDLGTYDGCLAAALLVAPKAPSLKTVLRALERAAG